MSKQRGDKLNELILSWPSGTVKTVAALALTGIGAALLWKYVKRGWVEPVGRGAYSRVGDKVTWLGGLYALQEKDDQKFYAAGRTALELHGYSHYAAMSNRKIFLFGPPKTRLPSWFMNRWGTDLVYSGTNLFPSSFTTGLTKYQTEEFAVTVSSPERAALEMLHHVPQKVGFDEASNLTLGLSTLRPELTQKLLKNCNSIKAKRLFLYFAKIHGHKWFSVLDQGKIDLGSGNREIVQGGVLDKTYKITVPKSENDETMF